MLAWIEILRREQIYLDFTSVRETRRFNAHLNLIYSVISFADLTGKEHDPRKYNHWIYYHYLSAIGQAAIREEPSGSRRCLTFQELCHEYKSETRTDFLSWMKEAERLFVDLSSNKKDLRWQRIQMLWFCIDRFLETVDPHKSMTTRDRTVSTQISSELKAGIAQHAKRYGLRLARN
jgi:hypothetical protein